MAEPARVWETELRKNRPSARIETMCLWSKSNEYLTFNETNVNELSTIDSYSLNDGHRDSRRRGQRYQVQTISLNDLLMKHAAPDYIDYLSLDTEGSEYEILKAFDFKRFTIGIITIEHNFTQTKLDF